MIGKIPAGLRRPLLLAAAGLFATVYLVMREVDSLLLTLESSGEQRYGMEALFGFRLDAETATNAVRLWAFVDGSQPFEWVQIHAWCDMLFAVGYASLLAFALSRAWLNRRWAPYVAIPVFVADVVENVVTIAMARQAAPYAVKDGQLIPPGMTGLLHWFSFAKWLLFGAAIAVLVVGLITRWHEIVQPPQAWAPRWRTVLWRLRVQVGGTALLAFIVAVPSRDRLGALEQVPDVLRWYFDPVHFDALSFTLSALGLLAIGAASWVSAHWQLHATPGSTAPVQGLRWPYRAIAGIAWAWFAVFLLQGLFPRLLTGIGVTAVPPWATSWQLAWPALAGAAGLAAVWMLHRFYGRGQSPTTPPAWHPRIAQAIHVLAVLPLAVGGLGVVRAAAGLAMLPGTSTRGAVWMTIGALAAIVVAPALLYVVAFVCRSETGENTRPITIKRPFSVGALVGTGLLGIALAIWPAEIGARLGTIGVLDAGLALGVLGLGGLVAINQRTEPIVVDQVDGSRIRPVQLPAITIIVVTMMVTGLADSVGNYHDVRTVGGPPATSRSLAEHFDAWQKAVSGCGPNVATTTPRIQPLVIVAAAGGGIRAAYWTERALLELTGARGGESSQQAACRHDSVFLVSAVSGGGVGSALWTLHKPGYQHDVAPYATALADQDALAAISAALLFRDSVRTLSAIDFVWPDRAAVMEQSWRDSLRPSGIDLDQPLLTLGAEWKPLLMLNGTDLETGCRVVIAPIGPANPPDLPRQCVDAGPRGTDFPAAYFAPEFVDTAQCNPGNLSVASAALLAARFPYVTPTGSMYACSNKQDPSAKKQVVRIQVGDGGYLENTGLQAALQAWRAIQPLVAAHNRDVLDPQAEPSQLAGTVIMPIVVSVGSGYRSLAVVPAPNRENEFIAPIASADIAAKGLEAPRLEAEVRAEFARPVPGTEESVPGLEVRFVAIAPSSRPEVTAPLGWTLSPLTQQTLDNQLADLVRPDAPGDLKFLQSLMGGKTLAEVLAPATTPGTFP